MTDTPNGGHTPPGGYAAYLTGRLAALGLSRNALARALGHRGASQVSRWCAGKAVPREKARLAVDAALAVVGVTQWRAEQYERPARRHASNMPPETPQDAPGATISGGAVPEDTSKVALRGTVYLGVGLPDPGPVVERYVVEGG